MFFCFLFFACEIYVVVFVADANLGINRNLCEFRGNKSEPNSCVIYGFFVTFGAVHVLKLVNLLPNKVMLVLLNMCLLIALILFP